MNIEIKNVTTRTEYVATSEGMTLAGTYQTNMNGVLTDISGTAYPINDRENVKGVVEGHIENNEIKYNYNHVADGDIDTVRQLTMGVVNSTTNANDNANDNDNQEGGAE